MASLVIEGDLDSFAKCKWFATSDVRVSKVDTMPKPHDDEVVMFWNFFSAALRFPVNPFVVEVLKRFEVKFHQLTLACFTKWSVFVWAGKSQGVEVDLDASLRMHRMHY